MPVQCHEYIYIFWATAPVIEQLMWELKGRWLLSLSVFCSALCLLHQCARSYLDVVVHAVAAPLQVEGGEGVAHCVPRPGLDGPAALRAGWVCVGVVGRLNDAATLAGDLHPLAVCRGNHGHRWPDKVVIDTIDLDRLMRTNQNQSKSYSKFQNEAEP